MPDPASIAREYVECVNRRDFDRIRQLLDSGYSYTGGDGQRQDGPQAAIDVVQMYTSAFPDVKSEIRQVHIAGDTAVVEFIARGTHQAELMGIAATGRKISMPICTVLDIKDGKITAEREYFDVMHMMQQLGVVPAPATA
ncbi:MAG: ester cyclase [Dehalococcoidia bacterium]|nr:ester cyclase [Dehalococcoidia bacterium]